MRGWQIYALLQHSLEQGSSKHMFTCSYTAHVHTHNSTYPAIKLPPLVVRCLQPLAHGCERLFPPGQEAFSLQLDYSLSDE